MVGASSWTSSPLPSRLWDHWGLGSLCEHQGALCSWLCSTTMIHAGNLGGEKHNVKTGAFQMYHLDSRWCNLCHNETPSVSCTVTFTLVYIFHLQPPALQNSFPSTSIIMCTWHFLFCWHGWPTSLTSPTQHTDGHARNIIQDVHSLSWDRHHL